MPGRFPRGGGLEFLRPIALASAQLAFLFVTPAEAIRKPKIDYSTFFPAERINAITEDSAGNIIIVGSEFDGNLPIVGAFQPEKSGSFDAFIAKIDPDESTILFSTYLGGEEWDDAQDVAIAPDGTIVVLGSTGSADFPLVDPIQDEFGDSFDEYCKSDLFLSRVAADGSTLLFSTFLGGEGCEDHPSLAIGRDGLIHVAGYTDSADFPLVAPIQPAWGGGVLDAFVMTVDAASSSLVFSTFLGGSADDWGPVLAATKRGTVWVSGTTESRDFPTIQALLDPPLKRLRRGWVAEIDPIKSELIFSSLLGGKGKKRFRSATDGGTLALGRHGDAYLFGTTFESDFPQRNALMETLPCAPHEPSLYLTRIAGRTHQMPFSTCFGNSLAHYESYHYASGLVADKKGRVYIAGTISDPDFPTLLARQNTHAGEFDAVLALVDTKKGKLIWSTFLGGSGVDWVSGIAKGRKKRLLLAVHVESDDFPLVRPLDLPSPGTSTARQAIVRIRVP